MRKVTFTIVEAIVRQVRLGSNQLRQDTGRQAQGGKAKPQGQAFQAGPSPNSAPAYSKSLAAIRTNRV